MVLFVSAGEWQDPLGETDADAHTRQARILVVASALLMAPICVVFPSDLPQVIRGRRVELHATYDTWQQKYDGILYALIIVLFLGPTIVFAIPPLWGRTFASLDIIL